jgi:D-alanyl-lipoteichoic acid acyltransferase DltB (MBOAT superfamily)
MPQFAKESIGFLKLENLAAGLTTFIIGLFKKVFLADNIAVFATPAFDAALYGIDLTFFEAWGASLAYAFQLYFYFSGYSDMALCLVSLYHLTFCLHLNQKIYPNFGDVGILAYQHLLEIICTFQFLYY